VRKTAIFVINDERLELPLYEKGDIVKPIEQSTTAIGATGTVEGITAGGLFVDVIWDKEKYPSKCGGEVRLGKGRMVNDLILINQ